MEKETKLCKECLRPIPTNGNRESEVEGGI